MGFTVVDKQVFGNKRLLVLSFVAGAAEENIATGLQYCDHFALGPQSITTSFYKMKTNVNSSGAAANGTIGCSGLVAGDQMFIYAYGR